MLIIPINQLFSFSNQHQCIIHKILINIFNYIPLVTMITRPQKFMVEVCLHQFENAILDRRKMINIRVNANLSSIFC